MSYAAVPVAPPVIVTVVPAANEQAESLQLPPPPWTPRQVWLTLLGLLVLPAALGALYCSVPGPHPERCARDAVVGVSGVYMFIAMYAGGMVVVMLVLAVFLCIAALLYWCSMRTWRRIEVWMLPRRKRSASL